VGWRDVLLDLSLYRRKKLDEVFEYIVYIFGRGEDRYYNVKPRLTKEGALEASSV